MFKRRKIYLVVLCLMLSADLLKHVIRHAKIPLQTTRKNIKKKKKDERFKKKFCPLNFSLFWSFHFNSCLWGNEEFLRSNVEESRNFVHADLNAAFLFLVKRFVVIIEVHGLLHEGICIFFPMEEEIILKEFYPLLVILRSASILLNLDSKCKLSFYFVLKKKRHFWTIYFFPHKT